MTRTGGPRLSSMPFFDKKQVVGLLDRLPEMDTGARTGKQRTAQRPVAHCSG